MIPKPEENMLNLSQQRIRLIIFTILSLIPLLGMGIDLIAPSLPAITHHLHTTEAFSKNLVTTYLFGYALGNFLVGFVSDTFGRRRITLFGLFLFVIASMLPILFSDPSILLVARFLQGLGIASVSVVGRAIFSDILSHDQIIRISTLVAAMWGIGPILGPVIGGYLQYYFDWRAGFYFFVIFGFIGFLNFYFFIPETHFHRQPMSFSQIKNNFKEIITHPIFMGLILLIGSTYSLLIVFNTLGPFFIQTTLGYSPVYFGHIAFFLGLSFLLGTFVCRRLLKDFQAEEIMLPGTLFFMAVLIVALGFAYFYPKNVWSVVVPSFFMFLATGILHPLGVGKGVTLFRHIAGSASAVMSLVVVLFTAGISLGMSFLRMKSAVLMVGIDLGLMGVAMGCCWGVIKVKD